MATDLGLVDSVIAELARDLLDRPVMSNLARPLYVERLVTRALLPAWRHVGSDWAGWELESEAGVRLEVKQSAARQTWTDQSAHLGKPTKAVFDIAHRTGHWADGGSRWVPGSCRLADVYVFAHHPVFALAEADQRDPEQSTFYVLPEHCLPKPQRTVGLAWLRATTVGVSYAGLEPAVTAVASSLPNLKRDQAGASAGTEPALP